MTRLPLAFAAVFSAALYWLLHRRGTPISPDGWAYWQGAVSLLDGKGYTYFSGHPIVAWPPGYTLYLAIFTRVFGATVTSILISNSFLTIAGAIGWAYLATRAIERQPVPVIFKWIVAAYVALFLACNQQYPLADNLKYALLPWLVFATWNLCNTTDQRAVALWTGVHAVVGIALVLTHNNAVAFVGAASVTIVVFARVPIVLRCVIAVITSAVPAACWQIVRVLLDQEGSHVVGLGAGRESAVLYAWQLLSGIGELLTPGPTVLRIAAAALLASVAVAGCVRGSPKRAWQLIGFFTLVATGATYVLFNVTWIDDPLSGRYLLFIPLSLVPLAVLCSGSYSHAARVLISAAVLIPLFVTTVFAFENSRKNLQQLGSPGYFVPRDGWITHDYRRGPPMRTPQGLLLAPLQWEEPKGRHRGLRDL